MLRNTKKRLIINDGFNPELAEGAKFTGLFEFPTIEPLKEIVIPKYLVPFSERNKAKYPSETFVMFYEHDDRFADVIRDPDEYIDDFARFAGIISPDNSLYRDMPLACQICNIYRNRLIGSYYQRHGIKVIGNCRWGDDRTYSSDTLGEPVSFAGLPTDSIVSVGTYGCIQSKRDKEQFRNGLAAMIDYLKPAAIIVYGAMPDSVFGKFKNKAKFINFKDWTSTRHRENETWGVE